MSADWVVQAVNKAPIAALLHVAAVAAETYDRTEYPGRYGDGTSSEAVLEWFPKLHAALADAGLLRP